MHRKVVFRMGEVARIAVACLVGVLLLAAAAGPARAELPAPVFMPGFPIVAGPQAIVMWQPVIGAEKYRVYEDGKQIAEVTGFQHVITLPKSGDHVYNVAAVDKDGKEGARTRDFRYTVQVLEKPKGIVALPKGDGVALRWEPVPSAIIYDVYKATGKDGPYNLVTSTQDRTYTDTSVKPDLDYLYKVSAKNASGAVSDFSDPVPFRVEVAKAAPKEEKKILAVRTRKLWEKKEIESALETVLFPDGVAVSAAASAGRSLIEILNQDGKRVETVYPPAGAEGTTVFHGMGAASDGNFWVTNNLTPELFLVDRKSGEILKSFKVEPIPETITPYKFFDVAEGPGGKLYVSDSSNNCVFVIDNGKIVNRAGKRGWGDGELNSPVFLDVYKDEVFVVDAGNNRILVFGTDGKYRRKFGAQGGVEAGTFMRVSGLSIDPGTGKIYVADRATNTIQIFETDGKFYGAMSNEDGTGQMPTAPVGFNVRGGKIAVAVPMGGMVQMFDVLGPKAP